MIEKIRKHKHHRMIRSMGRPRCHKHIGFHPKAFCFKPQGVPNQGLEVIELTQEEVEALRLKNIENLGQIECAKKMKISQSTFQRILTSANKKVSIAIVEGRAIRIKTTDFDG